MFDLYPIKNRLGKITPGVWRYCHVDKVIRKVLGDRAANAMWFEDADLIARAPQDLAALVDEVERLRSENQTLREDLSEAKKEIDDVYQMNPFYKERPDA